MSTEVYDQDALPRIEVTISVPFYCRGFVLDTAADLRVSATPVGGRWFKRYFAISADPWNYSRFMEELRLYAINPELL